jgi:hypothetical protein
MRHSLLRVVFTAFITATLSSSALAAEKRKPQPAPVHREEQARSHHESADAVEPETDGCGLGWQVTKKKTLSAVTTRGTINVSVPPTFGMTSGTLGCAQHPLTQRDVDGARYAFNNFDVLSIEMAEGQGEFLTGFARTLGCDDASLEAFSHMTQSHYRSIMNEGKATRIEMFDNIKTEMRNDPVLSARCNAV